MLHKNTYTSMPNVTDSLTRQPDDHVHGRRLPGVGLRGCIQQSNVYLARHDFKAAVDLYRQGRWNEACEAFAESLLDPGTNADATDEIQRNMAMCFAHVGNWETAFGHIQASGGDEQAFRRTVN